MALSYTPSTSELAAAAGIAVAGAAAAFKIATRDPVALSIKREKFSSLEDLRAGARRIGTENLNVAIFFDLTGSNTTYGLHDLDGNNNYMKTLRGAASALNVVDGDARFTSYVFGNGAHQSADKYVQNMFDDGIEHTMEQIIARYQEVVREYETGVRTWGAYTLFEPLVNKTVEIARANPKGFTFAVIIGDGANTDTSETVSAVRRASRFPCSFAFVGIPFKGANWGLLEHLDDMWWRRFDNWQTVLLEKYTYETMGSQFGLDCVGELLKQVQASRAQRAKAAARLRFFVMFLVLLIIAAAAAVYLLGPEDAIALARIQYKVVSSAAVWWAQVAKAGVEGVIMPSIAKRFEL